MHHFLPVPGLAGTHADEAAHAQHIVAESLGQLLVCGVPFAGIEFQSRCLLGIHIHGLFFVEIDAVSHPLRFEGDAMVVHLVVRVFPSFESLFRDGFDVVRLALGRMRHEAFLGLLRLEEHLGMHARLEGLVCLGGLDHQLHRLAFLQVHQDHQFVGYAVAVEIVVQLRGDLLAFSPVRVHAQLRAFFKGKVVVSESEHHGIILDIRLERSDGYLQCRSTRSHRNRECQQKHYATNTFVHLLY